MWNPFGREPNTCSRWWALAECFPQHRTTAAVLKDKRAEAVTVRSLHDWIEREIHRDISHAPFDAHRRRSRRTLQKSRQERQRQAETQNASQTKLIP